MSEDFVTVGKLGRARGVRGEMYVTPMTDFPDRFLGMPEIYLRLRNRWEKVKIDSTRVVSGRVVIKLEGVDSPEAAARMSNSEMAVPKDQLVKLPAGHHYIFDLIGCKVFDDGTNLEIGEITDVETYPANDVYAIWTTEGRRMLVPAVDRWVKSVDTGKKRVVIDRAGLMEP
ncbi:MAG: 16S rRNA processing protein RimM [Candidatus Zixiibacteriota bacterium]|nr:MAG: 16S rRNA processing protein RimM [candidate division Zixibacteria bacterium]